MTDQQKLEALIQKAIDGGWNFPFSNWEVDEDLSVWQMIDFEGAMFASEDYEAWSANDVIFNHDFAKSLWGDKEMVAYQFHSALSRDSSNLLESGAYCIWQYHIQQCVLADDPIDYAYQSVFGNKGQINE